MGPQGSSGPTGAQGPVGPVGPQGPQGVPGAAGTQAITGIFVIPSHKANAVGSTNSFTDTRFGTVDWVINDLNEDPTGTNGIHASMVITYTFSDVTNAQVLLSLIHI